MKLLFIFILTLIGLHSFQPIEAQVFTRQDSLRGSITPEREWWDLNYYRLSISVHPEDSTISGTNEIYFSALKNGKILQIELQEPLRIESIKQAGKTLQWKKDGYTYFVNLKKEVKLGTKSSIIITYTGKPVISKMPPWDGGFTWKYDTNGKPFIATSVQGEGASLWWPNKDHMYDEVDSMSISLTVPKGLIGVSNGRLRSKTVLVDSSVTFLWHVSNPINNYGVNVNIGDYVHFGEKYTGEKGELDCDYWVLSSDLEKAKIQFKDAKRTLEALEHWFGPYPFYEDSYKLVQVPYLGMEHQSSVTYGNGFKNGYRGTDLSKTGWGLEFDFIIVHESGHEWFANNITYKDMADMWIHESFTNYSESLFLEYFYGKNAGYEYVRGLRKRISNDKTIIAPYNVNTSGSGDMYYKGANMLHTIRQLVPSDSIWRAMLRGLNKEFYHKTVQTEEIESYISKTLNLKLDKIFDQYLRDIRIPVLQYYFQDKTVFYRWNQTVKGFELPIQTTINDSTFLIKPTAAWNFVQTEYEKKPIISFDPNFYITPMDLSVESSFKKKNE
ncbi:MAG: M1 family metallopeptidase [Bacteroidetes bacterium]|nr:M1 family metallopeptidase [Bacteroidota bacterium]NCQ10998.1 M1 family metallopeptidase [Bacteroidota bacterium]